MTDDLTARLLDTYTRGCAFKQRRQDLLTAEQNEALTFAIRNPTKSARAIVEALAAAGFPCSRDTITKHRKGNCLECQTN
jgi:hypothetical protein